MAVPKTVKKLLKSIRKKFDFLRPLAERVAAAELESIKADFESLLERLPKKLGGKKDKDWDDLLSEDAELENDVNELGERLDEYLQFVCKQDLAPQPATRVEIGFALFHSLALTAVLLLLIGRFWHSGPSASVIKSRADVSTLEADVTRAQEKSNAAKERLAKAEEERAAAEKAFLTAVNKGVAELQPSEEPEDTSEETGESETQETPAEQAEKSTPAEDETEEPPPPPDRSISPEPNHVPQENPPKETPSDAAGARTEDDAARDHAAAAAARAEASNAAAKKAAIDAAGHANITLDRHKAVLSAAQTVHQSMAAALDAAELAVEARKATQRAVTEAVEAPRKEAESIRDALAKRMKAAKAEADAAAAAEEAVIGKQAEAQAKLAQEEGRATPFSVCLFAMCCMFGALGACLRLTGSMGAYIAARKLYRSWLVYYYSMPIEGALVGIAIYLVIGAGLFTPDVNGTDAAPIGNPLFIYALAMLAGTFSKNAMRKLRDIADATFGKPSEKDALQQ